MLGQYEAVCQYLLAEKTVTGVAGNASVEAEAAQVRHLSSVFQKAKPTVEDATNVLVKLGEPTNAFTAENRGILAKVVSTVVRNQPTRLSSNRTQSHMYLYSYLTEQLWTTILSETVSTKEQERQLCEFMLVIGCPHPNEKTYVLMAAMLNAASKTRRTPVQAKRILDELKQTMVTLRTSHACRQTMQVFPEDVQEFLIIHSDCYTEGNPPVDSRIPVDAILAKCKKAVQPARNSNNAMKPSMVDAHQPDQNAQLVQPMFQSLVANALGMQFQNLMPQMRRNDDIPIQYFGGAQPVNNGPLPLPAMLGAPHAAGPLPMQPAQLALPPVPQHALPSAGASVGGQLAQQALAL